MARITVEDCLKKMKNPNRFELVLEAARRARDILSGSVDPQVAWNNDKATVVALREIAAGVVDDQTGTKQAVSSEQSAQDAGDASTD